jgi:hypothetical protein
VRNRPYVPQKRYLVHEGVTHAFNWDKTCAMCSYDLKDYQERINMELDAKTCKRCQEKYPEAFKPSTALSFDHLHDAGVARWAGLWFGASRRVVEVANRRDLDPSKEPVSTALTAITYELMDYLVKPAALPAPEPAPDPEEPSAVAHFDLTDQEVSLVCHALHHLLSSDLVSGKQRATLAELSVIFDYSTPTEEEIVERAEAEAARWCAYEDCDQEPIPGESLCQGHREQEEAEMIYQAAIALHDAGKCGEGCQLCKAEADTTAMLADEPENRRPTVAKVRAQHRLGAVVGSSEGALKPYPPLTK